VKLCLEKILTAWVPWMLIGSVAGTLMFWP
jgi:hypothetical protein